MLKQIVPEEMCLGPQCYQAATCHIKLLCADKRYTLTNQQRVCVTCVWDDSRRQIPFRIPVEIKVVG